MSSGITKEVIPKEVISNNSCRFLRLRSDNKEECKIIKFLAEVTEGQKNKFLLLSPWEPFLEKCKEGEIVHVYISFNIANQNVDDVSIREKTLAYTRAIRVQLIKDTLLNRLKELHTQNKLGICGWMTVYERAGDKITEETGSGRKRKIIQKVWYLGEIVSANATDPNKFYTGIGEQFIKFLYNDAKAYKIDYIFFVAIGSARSFYESWEIMKGDIQKIDIIHTKLGISFTPLFTSVNEKGEQFSINNTTTLNNVRRQGRSDVYMYTPIQSKPVSNTIAKWAALLNEKSDETLLASMICNILNKQEDKCMYETLTKKIKEITAKEDDDRIGYIEQLIQLYEEEQTEEGKKDIKKDLAEILQLHINKYV